MQYVEVFSAFSDFIQTFILHGGYLILFSLTLLEGLPLIGMAIPGHIAILIGGFMAKIGTLNLVWVLSVSILGALLGDFVGFMIGRRYGMDFIKKLRPYFFITDSHIQKACSLLSKHTGKALIIGRFTPATRALMPFLVGASSPVSIGRFWLYNIVGGISWVTLSVFIGYIFGSAYHIVSGQIGKLLFIAILSTAIFIWGYRFVNQRFHIFRRYELFTLLINALSLWAFAATVDKLLDNSFRLSLDIWFNITMEKIGNLYPSLISISKIVSAVGGVYVMAILGLLFSLYFALHKKWRSTAIMFLAVSLTGLASGFIKILFMTPRPINALDLLGDPSFPSSHASMSIAFFMVLTYLLAPKINNWIKRELMIVLFVLVVVLIGLSRLILNVHWFSDIIGGWSLGLFIATSSILFVRYLSFIVIKKK